MSRSIRVNKIVKYTTTDGHGLRYSVYTQGCEHKCAGCHNPQTHDLNGGFDMNIQDVIDDIKTMPYITGVTVTGGDPLNQYKPTLELCHLIREHFNYDIILFTGYTYEEIRKKFPEILTAVDYIVDGKFEQDKANPNLYFRGSSNQQYIDVRKTALTGEIVTRDN